MEMLWTTLGFGLITAVAIWLHLRMSHSGSGTIPGTAPCPRCATAVPPGSVYCPRCAAPQQVFELVQAATVEGELAGGGGEPRALVRADQCVGCGTCVDACPEPGAITMRGKLAVVDDARCRGHGDCVAACPIGAISVTTGAAVNRVSVPNVNAHFETNVPGLHVVGELGGRGLIKNAINEGKMAVEHITRRLAAEPRPLGSEGTIIDVVVVGSGPAGLSAGIEALRSGLSYLVLEQGSLSESVRKYPRHKLLLAEPVSMPLYGDLWVADTSKEDLLQIWEQVVESTGLQVRTGEKVENITHDAGCFRVETSAGTHLARRVVLAMGRRGSPRKLRVPGEELDKVFYEVIEMEQFAKQRVLVVGGGDSAIECAVGLANQSGTTVQLSYRRRELTRVKSRNQEKLDRAVSQGKIALLLGTQVREIRPDVVVIEGPDGTMLLPNDVVMIRIGGDAPYAFLERIGVEIVQKDVPIPSDQAKVS